MTETREDSIRGGDEVRGRGRFSREVGSVPRGREPWILLGGSRKRESERERETERERKREGASRLWSWGRRSRVAGRGAKSQRHVSGGPMAAGVRGPP